MSLPIPKCKSCGIDYTKFLCPDCGEIFCDKCVKKTRCPECGKYNIISHDPGEGIQPAFPQVKKSDNPYVIWR
ncbi:hypothetical protein KAR91_81575 [Candidatus Pacearchaeota archaeon]|nr:hypothetical protein [Candidatus Pacearchaeota archaeon]